MMRCSRKTVVTWKFEREVATMTTIIKQINTKKEVLCCQLLLLLLLYLLVEIIRIYLFLSCVHSLSLSFFVFILLRVTVYCLVLQSICLNVDRNVGNEYLSFFGERSNVFCMVVKCEALLNPLAASFQSLFAGICVATRDT